jgi:hypothetical protein
VQKVMASAEAEVKRIDARLVIPGPAADDHAGILERDALQRAFAAMSIEDRKTWMELHLIRPKLVK